MNTTTPSRHLPSRTRSLAPSPLLDSLAGPFFPLRLARPLSGSSRLLRLVAASPACCGVSGTVVSTALSATTHGLQVPDGCDLVAGLQPEHFPAPMEHHILLLFIELTLSLVLLVLGATGGVGVSVVQIGKVCRAVVIVVVARGDEKVRFLKLLGVDHVVDASQENIIQSVKELLKRRKLKGVDVLYDPVGGKLTKDSLKLLNILGCKYLGNRVSLKIHSKICSRGTPKA